MDNGLTVPSHVGAFDEWGNRGASAGGLLATAVQARSPSRVANPAGPGVRGDDEGAPQGKPEQREAGPARKASTEYRRVRTVNRHWSARSNLLR
jgi:hypothetical protein